MSFNRRLRSVQRKTKSLLCIGLDTDTARIPAFLRTRRDPVAEFNRRIIDATADLVCAYKFNLAFYESAGSRGLAALHAALEKIPAGTLTIGDGKRGDIGNTAEMYAKALFGDFAFTACTVNPYMGGDSVEPFLRDGTRGVFILAVTSNPGARDFQYLPVRGRPLYERVIRRARIWNTSDNCGLVVGATRPAQIKRARALAPDLPFLIPGIGAQGGDLRAAVRYGCDRDGYLAVINASRSILYASGDRDFATAARAAALTLRDTINRYRETYFP